MRMRRGARLRRRHRAFAAPSRPGTPRVEAPAGADPDARGVASVAKEAAGATLRQATMPPEASAEEVRASSSWCARYPARCYWRGARSVEDAIVEVAPDDAGSGPRRRSTATSSSVPPARRASTRNGCGGASRPRRGDRLARPAPLRRGALIAAFAELLSLPRHARAARWRPFAAAVVDVARDRRLARGRCRVAPRSRTSVAAAAPASRQQHAAAVLVPPCIKHARALGGTAAACRPSGPRVLMLPAALAADFERAVRSRDGAPLAALPATASRSPTPRRRR